MRIQYGRLDAMNVLVRAEWEANGQTWECAEPMDERVAMQLQEWALVSREEAIARCLALENLLNAIYAQCDIIPRAVKEKEKGKGK